MAEYIEREKVYEMLHAIGGCGAETGSWADGWDKAIDTAIDGLTEIPAADVRPERHGRWVNKRGNKGAWHLWRCTACGEAVVNPALKRINMPKYCLNCGAKMDGEDGEKPNA